MSECPDDVPHRRYTVTLRFLGGSSKEVRVITNRGEAKAVYLAGEPILRGYGFDRNEW